MVLNKVDRPGATEQRCGEVESCEAGRGWVGRAGGPPTCLPAWIGCSGAGACPGRSRASPGIRTLPCGLARPPSACQRAWPGLHAPCLDSVALPALPKGTAPPASPSLGPSPWLCSPSLHPPPPPPHPGLLIQPCLTCPPHPTHPPHPPAVFDVFAHLGASDDQLDFPVLYASAREVRPLPSWCAHLMGLMGIMEWDD